MIIEIKNETDLEDIENQDIIIVGAGTIGLYLANRLNKENDDLNILIIEYGNENANSSQNEYHSESIGKKHIGTIDGRAIGIGGTSTLWGGQLAEFEEADFKEWPIKYSDIKKYYAKVYAELGLEGALSDQDYQKCINGDIENDFDIEHLYTRWLNQPNFYEFFKEIIHKNKNIRIIKNTTVNNISLNKNMATSVECIASNSFKYNLDGKKFVFANGTLGINQFFLSTAELSTVPWKKNSMLGRYFQDHLAAVVGTLSLKNKILFRQLYENRWVNGIKIQPKLKLSKNARSYKKNGVVLFFSFKSKFEDSLVRIKSVIKNPSKIINLKTLSVFLKDIYIIRKSILISIYKLLFKKRIHAIFDNEQSIEINIQSEQIPNENSKITLDKGKKLKTGLYKTKTNWAFGGEEEEAIKDLCLSVNKFFKKIGIGEIEFNKDIYDNLKCNFHDTNHQCGGMKMSFHENDGVVDKNCKVWSTENIWIAGAAVFPSSSHANTTLTALALCEKMIKELTIQK